MRRHPELALALSALRRARKRAEEIAIATNSALIQGRRRATCPHAGIPAFDVSAIIPGLAVITSPVPTADGSAVLIDTSQDLHITWAPIAIGQIRFHINAGTYLPNSTSVTLACTFEGASGAGVASHTLLSSLKDMSAGAATSVGLSSGLQATTVVDGLTIETWSYQSPTSPNPDFSVTLQ